MDSAGLLALIGIMAALAAVPSASVLLVITRTATRGIGNGVAVVAGIVLGDLIFIVLAIAGLSMIAEWLGDLFAWIRILSGLFLIWYGIVMFLGRERSDGRIARDSSSPLGSFLAGFLLTMGDLKAVFFYASLFPMFIDVTSLAVADIASLIIVMVVTVGVIKLGYVVLAKKMRWRLQPQRHVRLIERAAGGLLIGTGVYVMTHR